ncbi:MAG: hypothetical protein PHY92_05250 [Alphaproteobacteria bacterium]|nr:hypothetical protein [Alphaproteobacteria bacterium]
MQTSKAKQRRHPGQATPAKAGEAPIRDPVQYACAKRTFEKFIWLADARCWIPAFAGMTKMENFDA